MTLITMPQLWVTDSAGQLLLIIILDCDYQTR